MVSLLPESRHLRYVPDPPKDFEYPDVISQKYDVEGIAAFLDADARFNKNTGSWTITLFKGVPETQFHPTLTLDPHPEAELLGTPPRKKFVLSSVLEERNGREPRESEPARSEKAVHPSLTYQSGLHKAQVHLEGISEIRAVAENDSVNFVSVQDDAITVFLLRPNGEFTQRTFPMIPGKKSLVLVK